MKRVRGNFLHLPVLVIAMSFYGPAMAQVAAADGVGWPLQSLATVRNRGASAPPSVNHRARLTIGTTIAGRGELAFGFHPAAGNTVDLHEINTAFASHEQDPGGMAGARLSFHF